MLRSSVSRLASQAARRRPLVSSVTPPSLQPFAGRGPAGRPRLFAAVAVPPAQDPTKLDEITTLANGVRVASEALPDAFSGVGVYIEAGSRYESEYLRGTSHIMDRLAFKSTSRRSADDMLEAVESLGGNIQCASSRESMMYQAATFNSAIPTAVEILAETIRSPLLTDDEIAQQLDTAAYEIKEIWSKPELILPELVHMAAFRDNTLGNPLLCPEERLASIDRHVICAYRDAFYRPDRMVVAFAGVPHHEAVALAEQHFGDMKPTLQQQPDDLGGFLSLPAQPPPLNPNQPNFTHIQLAFEGLPISSDDIYALATLQTLLGGGGSFSAGGPGKGMYSRLYTNVLNQHAWVESCVAFNHSYADSGLFGIAASCYPGRTAKMLEVMCRELRSLALDGGFSALGQVEVNRAKNQLRSSLLMNLESRMVELEDLGRQVQVHGHKIPVHEMVRRINDLTVDDLRRVAKIVVQGLVQNPGRGSGAPTVVLQEADVAGLSAKQIQWDEIQDIIYRWQLGKR
ncbi:mitochondrial processing peptidase alpha [Grosmannia clavigera kw1407]|uniref:Mitochondrial-processing peptidase subunit alpha n=1 Tax=Grosmannia clavigera (strain kw1407 / UAMH 11150) TaxID=655863 RepID=F0XIY3_GROCL|nr:mitochondrial processing peptidase alpha [Grosmannia clavigera kw1407]EFX02329.1 mitochondrial processing peptidase alpha [Grosmannia clavigera kw1407]